MRSLLVLYIVIVGVRFALTTYVTEPIVMGDELSYKAMAQSFYQTGSFYPEQHFGVSFGFTNVLYQLLISPAFLVTDFYGGIKLINCLLITLTVFPIYAFVRGFRDHRSALAAATLSAFLPNQTIAAFVMAENLYVPLFWAAAYFLYRTLCENRTLAASLAGVFSGLLFLTKPQAISFAVAGIATTVFLFGVRRHLNTRTGGLVRSVVLLLATAVAVYAIGSLFLLGKGAFASPVGMHYTGAMRSPDGSAYLKLSFLKMAAAHFSIGIVLFILPVFQMMHGVWSAWVSRDHRQVLLGALLTTLFAAAFSMTLLFTESISYIENNLRLHGRYYNFVFPAFIIASFVYSRELPSSRALRGGIAAAAAMLLAMAVWAYFHFPSPTFVIDFPDWAWWSLNLVHPRSFKIFAVAVLSFWALWLILCLGKGKVRDSITIACLGGVCAFASIAQVRTTAKIIEYYHSDFAAERDWIRGTIGDFSESVAIIDEGYARTCNFAFWLPYQYTAMITQPSQQPITEANVGNARWVIVIGSHPVAMSVLREHVKGGVRIIERRNGI